MTKREILLNLETDHQKLVDVVKGLSDEQMANAPVFGDWTVKDIIAHIAFWRDHLVRDIDDVLAGKVPWYGGPGFTEEVGAKFNAKIVKESRSKSLRQILEEWRISHQQTLGRVAKLSENELNRETGNQWPDGTPMTVASLFTYEYEGAGHEGGHAKQIEDCFFKK